MTPLRSRTTTAGRNAAGARALWRATGMTDSDFGKPIVAIAMGQGAGLLDSDVHTVHTTSFDEWLDTWDIRSGKAFQEAIELFHTAPGGRVAYIDARPPTPRARCRVRGMYRTRAA
ncbi:MAG TPA: hypothetical protein VIW24_23830 [Aldersonia sp.]